MSGFMNRDGSMKYSIHRVFLAAVLFLLGALPAHAADTYELTYAGRIVDSTGKPLAGPVNLQVDFYSSATGSDRIAISAVTVSSVALTDGVFQIRIPLVAADAKKVFSSPTTAVYIQITDTTNNKTYSRQKYSVVPFALNVPVDGSTIGYDSNGKLTVLTTTTTTTTTTPTLSTITGTLGTTSGGTGSTTLTFPTGTATVVADTTASAGDIMYRSSSSSPGGRLGVISAGTSNNGNVLTVVNGLPSYAAPTVAAGNITGNLSPGTLPLPKSGYYFFDDFFFLPPNGYPWAFNNTNATMASIASTSGNHPGVLEVTGNTSTNDIVTLALGANSKAPVILDSTSGTITIETSIFLTGLQSGATEFFYVGLHSLTATNYDGGGGSGVYFKVGMDSGGPTVQGVVNSANTLNSTSSSATTASAWHKLAITITNNTSVAFSLDGTALGSSPVTTGIPSVAMIPVMHYEQTNTTGGGKVDIDYFFFSQVFGTTR